MNTAAAVGSRSSKVRSVVMLSSSIHREKDDYKKSFVIAFFRFGARMQMSSDVGCDTENDIIQKKYFSPIIVLYLFGTKAFLSMIPATRMFALDHFDTSELG